MKISKHDLRRYIRQQIKEAVLHGRKHYDDDIDYPVDFKTNEIMVAIVGTEL